jgi:hypothetical protein
MSSDLAVDTIDPALEIDSIDVASRDAASARPTTLADLVGVAMVASVVCAATQIAAHLQGFGIGRSRTLATAVGVLCAVTVAGLVAIAVRERPTAVGLVERTTEVWRDPPGGWAPFALGTIAVFPLYVLFTPMVFGDSDSARILAASRYLLDGNPVFDYYTGTQEPFLPPLLFAPAVALNSLAAVKLLSLLWLQVAAGVIAYLTHRMTRSMWGAGVAALSLMCLTAFTERAVKVPMYAAMLSLGYMGAWFAYRSVSRQDVRWRTTVAAGVCLALAPEAHGVGQLFLAAPVLVAVFAPSVRSAVGSVGRIYGVALLAMVPRIVVNLWDGGLNAVASPRADYWITGGYLTEIQNRFMLYEGVSEPRGEYLADLPTRFVELLGPHGWIVVAVAALGAVIAVRGRARVFLLAAIGFYVLAITVKQIPPFARYYAPLWPGLAILVGIAVAALARRARPIAALAVTAVLVGVAFVTLRNESARFEHARLNIEMNATRGIVTAVDDDKGVIGSRAAQVFYSVTADVTTWGGQFLTEEEHVTYLTWPSDEEVLEVLDRHDIGWVYISEVMQLETDYNDTWLLPSYGSRARHVTEIADSPNFCRWRDVGFNIVYKVGACPPGGPPGVADG